LPANPIYCYMISMQQIALRLALAAVLGSIVGSERQRHEWAAGLRTHMLVCLGAALIMIVSMFGFADVIGRPGIVLDPSRVAAQVVSGIGFLGAGTIIFLRREVVRGLTTAAGLWTVAGIGLAAGGGLYFAAVITTAIVFIILAALKPIEARFFNKNKFNGVTMVLEKKQVSLEYIEEVFKAHKIKYTQISLSPLLEEDLDEIKITVQKVTIDKNNLLIVIEDLRKVKGVREVNFVLN
jgi:putative Mg2+ transporter-C (MgtC) family protein